MSKDITIVTSEERSNDNYNINIITITARYDDIRIVTKSDKSTTGRNKDNNIKIAYNTLKHSKTAKRKHQTSTSLYKLKYNYIICRS